MQFTAQTQVPRHAAPQHTPPLQARSAPRCRSRTDVPPATSAVSASRCGSPAADRGGGSASSASACHGAAGGGAKPDDSSSDSEPLEDSAPKRAPSMGASTLSFLRSLMGGAAAAHVWRDDYVMSRSTRLDL